jgi:hypothetical protein
MQWNVASHHRFLVVIGLVGLGAVWALVAPAQAEILSLSLPDCAAPGPLDRGVSPSRDVPPPGAAAWQFPTDWAPAVLDFVSPARGSLVPGAWSAVANQAGNTVTVSAFTLFDLVCQPPRDLYHRMFPVQSTEALGGGEALEDPGYRAAIDGLDPLSLVP